MKQTVSRRSVLQAGLAGAAALSLGTLGSALPRWAGAATRPLSSQRLSDNLLLISGAGGNIVANGGSVSVGAGGMARLYSGSVAGSSGLTALGTPGAFRYNSARTASNFTRVAAAPGIDERRVRRSELPSV